MIARPAGPPNLAPPSLLNWKTADLIVVISTAGRDGLRVTPTVAVVFGVVLAVGVFHCCAVS